MNNVYNFNNPTLHKAFNKEVRRDLCYRRKCRLVQHKSGSWSTKSDFSRIKITERCLAKCIGPNE